MVEGSGQNWDIAPGNQGADGSPQGKESTANAEPSLDNQKGPEAAEPTKQSASQVFRENKAPIVNQPQTTKPTQSPPHVVREPVNVDALPTETPERDTAQNALVKHVLYRPPTNGADAHGTVAAKQRLTNP